MENRFWHTLTQMPEPVLYVKVAGYVPKHEIAETRSPVAAFSYQAYMIAGVSNVSAYGTD